MLLRITLLIVAVVGLQADVRDCVCDLRSPAIVQTRGCNLCRIAETHEADANPAFLLKDNDPLKPNRWLALPHGVYDGANPLARMSASERLALWTVAIEKGRELWGDGWGVAMNSDLRRQQCHAHVHIGKLLDGQETSDGFYIDGPAQLPAIADGTGLWFHPSGDRLHVHPNGQATEYVLMK